MPTRRQGNGPLPDVCVIHHSQPCMGSHSCFGLAPCLERSQPATTFCFLIITPAVHVELVSSGWLGSKPQGRVGFPLAEVMAGGLVEQREHKLQYADSGRWAQQTAQRQWDRLHWGIGFQRGG